MRPASLTSESRSMRRSRPSGRAESSRRPRTPARPMYRRRLRRAGPRVRPTLARAGSAGGVVARAPTSSAAATLKRESRADTRPSACRSLAGNHVTVPSSGRESIVARQPSEPRRAETSLRRSARPKTTSRHRGRSRPRVLARRPPGGRGAPCGAHTRRATRRRRPWPASPGALTPAGRADAPPAALPSSTSGTLDRRRRAPLAPTLRHHAHAFAVLARSPCRVPHRRSRPPLLQARGHGLRRPAPAMATADHARARAGWSRRSSSRRPPDG